MSATPLASLRILVKTVVLGVVILVLVLGLRKGPLDVIAERFENRRQEAARKLRDAADAAAEKKPAARPETP